MLEENRFELEAQIETDLPLILADRSALLRAIQNLISNAVKYSGSARWVCVAAKPDSGSSAGAIRISVEDRGPGIDPRDATRIFEPFYRGREAASAQIPGNGLGLSIVRHIVEAHGGEIRVENAAGGGSRFVIRLNAAPAPVTQTNTEDSKAPVISQPVSTSGVVSRTDP
jgi:signal transduction histidine kinase